MNTNRINQIVAQYLSLPQFQIRKDLSVFKRLIPRPRLMLDIGSGANKRYQVMLEAVSHVGIDLFEPSDVKGDVTTLPFRDSIASLALCTEVLEHVQEPLRVLSEARRILADDGYLMLTIPFLWGEHDHVDFYRWTERGIRTLLAQAGFDVITLRRRGGLFSAVGCMIAQFPQQVFGTFGSQKNSVLRLLYVSAIAAMLPIPWVLSLLDYFDRNRKFVIGFSVLCRK